MPVFWRWRTTLAAVTSSAPLSATVAGPGPSGDPLPAWVKFGKFVKLDATARALNVTTLPPASAVAKAAVSEKGMRR